MAPLGRKAGSPRGTTTATLRSSQFQNAINDDGGGVEAGDAASRDAHRAATRLVGEQASQRIGQTRGGLFRGREMVDADRRAV